CSSSLILITSAKGRRRGYPQRCRRHSADLPTFCVARSCLAIESTGMGRGRRALSSRVAHFLTARRVPIASCDVDEGKADHQLFAMTHDWYLILHDFAGPIATFVAAGSRCFYHLIFWPRSGEDRTPAGGVSLRQTEK